MRDIPEARMFILDGRKPVEEWIGFLHGHSQLMALVSVFQDTLTLEENITSLIEAATVKGIKWKQRCYLYSGDVALLFLVTQAKDRKAFVAHLDRVRDEYHQRAYILWDGDRATLVTATNETILPVTYTGSLDSLDELAGYIIPGFKTDGHFPRTMSYVQMRDYQTRPKS